MRYIFRYVFLYMLKNHWQIYIQLIGERASIRERIIEFEMYAHEVCDFKRDKEQIQHVTLFMNATFIAQEAYEYPY